MGTMEGNSHVVGNMGWAREELGGGGGGGGGGQDICGVVPARSGSFRKRNVANFAMLGALRRRRSFLALDAHNIRLSTCIAAPVCNRYRSCARITGG